MYTEGLVDPRSVPPAGAFLRTQGNGVSTPGLRGAIDCAGCWVGPAWEADFARAASGSFWGLLCLDLDYLGAQSQCVSGDLAV